MGVLVAGVLVTIALVGGVIGFDGWSTSSPGPAEAVVRDVVSAPAGPGQVALDASAAAAVVRAAPSTRLGAPAADTSAGEERASGSGGGDTTRPGNRTVPNSTPQSGRPVPGGGSSPRPPAAPGGRLLPPPLDPSSGADAVEGVTHGLGQTVGGINPQLGETVTDTGQALGEIVLGVGGG